MNIYKYKYSVIVPHFNDEDGLKHLLSSIPKRPDIQVIVVDDRSSSDRFRKIIAESGLPNIKGFVNDRVKSAGTCRNIGLENCEGKYLVFSDSDDYFTTNAFDSFDMATKRDENSDIYYFKVDSINEDGSSSKRHLTINELVESYLKRKTESSEARLRLAYHVPWGRVIKARAIIENKIKFDETIVSNDGIFSLKIGKAARKIFASNDVVYHSVIKRGGLTSKKAATHYRVRIEVYARYFNMLNKKERKLLHASPLPLLYYGFRYGLTDVFSAIVFLKKNKVCFFRYYRIKKTHLKRFFS